MGFILARKGSKGIKSKNITDLGGIPLIEWTFKAAMCSNKLDMAFLSTNDDKIIKLAKKHTKLYVPFKRPEYLSQDNSSTVDVIEHGINFLEAEKFEIENIVLLQPTSPFRTSEDIDHAIEGFESSSSSTLFSGCEPFQHPEDCVYYDDNIVHRISLSENLNEGRQNYKKVVFIDGAIYISSVKNFKETKTFIKEDSSIYEINNLHAIDIDTPFDLTLAKALLEYFGKNPHKENKYE